jgi:predicted ATPase
MGKKEKQAKEKPLEKMTATELRQMAADIPEITGASGMNKAELIKEIKSAKGIEDKGGGRKSKVSMRDLKKRIKELKEKRQEMREADDKKMAAIYRRRLSRLKKKTRKAA